MEYLQEFLKLSGNDIRFRIMLLLYQEELCVCEISGILGLNQPTISKHLTKLRDTKFVETLQKGKFVYYSLISKDSNISLFLDNILITIGNYPQLLEDQKKLNKREIFLVKCSACQ